jgi:hypothetical protein
MTVAFRKSFTRDLKKVKDRGVLDSVQRAIEQGAEALVSSAYLRQLRHLRLQDNRFSDVVHLLLTERFGDVVVV